MNQGLGLLHGTGLPMADQAAILLAVSGHISYAAIRANLSRPPPGSGAPMGTLMAHLAGTGRLPWVDAAFAAGTFTPNDRPDNDDPDNDDPDDFKFGLSLILDGVEALIARRQRS